MDGAESMVGAADGVLEATSAARSYELGLLLCVVVELDHCHA